MPIYPLLCIKCKETFELYLACHQVKDARCPICSSLLSLSWQDLRLSHTSFKPHYNWGLGEFIESRDKLKSLLKKKNLVEVGNDSGTCL